MANVFHVSCVPSVDPFTPAAVAAVAVIVRNAYVARFKSFISTSGSIGPCLAQDLSSDTGASGVASGSIAGTDAATAGAANVSMCITWKIDRHYRGGHPRTYMWGLTISGPSGPNTWNASILTNATTAANGFMNDLGAGVPGSGITTMGLVAIHRKRNKLVLDVPLISPITAAVIDSRIDSQRRRLGKDR
jgi:hypothetical protein